MITNGLTKKRMLSSEQIKINNILNSNSKIVRNFYINGIKDERVKVAKKRAEQFIMVYFIIEKKKGFFWNKQYMEAYVLLPDPIKELKIIELSEFERVPYEEFFPNKINITTIEELDIPKLIYDVYNNYIDRLDVYNNIHKYADLINIWDKQINDQIKGISEAEIEVKE